MLCDLYCCSCVVAEYLYFTVLLINKLRKINKHAEINQRKRNLNMCMLMFSHKQQTHMIITSHSLCKARAWTMLTVRIRFLLGPTSQQNCTVKSHKLTIVVYCKSLIMQDKSFCISLKDWNSEMSFKYKVRVTAGVIWSIFNVNHAQSRLQSSHTKTFTCHLHGIFHLLKFLSHIKWKSYITLCVCR